MKTTLVMAITLNGFIAGPGDDTNWVKDIDALYRMVAKFGVAIMGRRTYDECVKYDAFPYKGAFNIVMTHDKNLFAQSSDRVLFTDASPKKVLEILRKKGIDRALVIGGGHINGSFLKDRLIDEIIFDIHPLLMANGIRVFESDFPYQQLECIDVQQLPDQLLRVRYKVKHQ